MTRRRFVYRPNERGEMEAVEVSPDYQRHDDRQPLYTDRYMEGVRATDGTDIGSRAKRRQYMQANGFADADDFKGAWAKQAQEREAAFRGLTGREERTRDVRAAIEQLRRRR